MISPLDFKAPLCTATDTEILTLRFVRRRLPRFCKFPCDFYFRVFFLIVNTSMKNNFGAFLPKDNKRNFSHIVKARNHHFVSATKEKRGTSSFKMRFPRLILKLRFVRRRIPRFCKFPCKAYFMVFFSNVNNPPRKKVLSILLMASPKSFAFKKMSSTICFG